MGECFSSDGDSLAEVASRAMALGGRGEEGELTGARAERAVNSEPEGTRHDAAKARKNLGNPETNAAGRLPCRREERLG
jgi:hypothetical protein